MIWHDCLTGFQLSPSFDFTLYSDGSTDNTPTVSLASQPIESLGPVMVTLTASPSDPLPCADCVSSGTLTFTSENWFIPQKMPFSYQKAGCSNMVVQAKGGGYDWNLFQTTWTVYTCAGSASQGCVSPPQCGSSLVSSQWTLLIKEHLQPILLFTLELIDQIKRLLCLNKNSF